MNATEWNVALFKHFFVANTEAARPVSRLPVTPEELVKVLGSSGTDPGRARDDFLDAIRCSPSAFRRHLSIDSIGRRAWDRRHCPPFLTYLVFTCFAAASLESITIEVGVFRERLRQLLEHEEGVTYALRDLPRLWEAFKDWLDEMRRSGAPFRELILPDPGRRTLIGYSVQLAFPARPDRLTLLDVLRERDLSAVPTVPEAFQCIGRARNRFSPDFRYVFDRARNALEHGRDTSELEAIWSAILEASAVASAKSTAENARIQYQLFLQEDELLRADPFLVASRPTNTAAQGTISFDELGEPLGEFRFLVRAIVDGGTAIISKLLLVGALSDRLPDLQRSPVVRAVLQGLLLFRRNDNATWELVASRPEEGTARVLVKESLAETLLRLFATKPSSRSSQFEGWIEVGPFDVSTVGEASRESLLANIRCLQRTRVGLQLHITGGVRVDSGYLGMQGLLPRMRISGAEKLTLFAIQSAAGSVRTTRAGNLIVSAEDPDTFMFPAGQDDLEGTFNLVATREGHVFASREVAFHSRVLGFDYAEVTEPQRWIAEGSGPDVVPASTGTESFLSLVRDDVGTSRDRFSILSGIDGETEHDAVELSVDDDPRLDRFVEAVAAVSLRKKGLAESELLDLFDKTTHVGVGPHTWDILRAWIEAGYLDVLSRRHWRGRVYFARHPRLVVSDEEPGSRVVLHGLAPYRLRSVARKLLREIGAVELRFRSFSKNVGTPLAWVVESGTALESVARRLGLGSLTFVREPRNSATQFDSMAEAGGEPLPGYECQGVWDWESGGFRRRRSVDFIGGVRLEWHSRVDRPDQYIVAGNDGRVWATFARTWALLVGYRWAQRRAFESVGRTTLIRPFASGPNVPLPVARALVLRSCVASGPIDIAGRGRGYAYRTRTQSERQWLLQWLCGVRDDTEVRRRLAWLFAASTTSKGDDVIPLPVDLRRRLSGLSHISEAKLIADRRIPRRMLPHLRRTIELAGA